MNELIRWIIIFLVFLLVIIVRIKTKGKLQISELLICFIVIFGGFSLILFMIPIEDLFITFKKTEDIYKYDNLKNLDSNSNVIEGEKSILIIFDDKSYFYSKCDKGLKLGKSNKTNVVYKKWQDGYRISIIRYGNTDDYYVNIINLKGKDFNIIDSLKTEFVNNNIKVKNSKNIYYRYVGYIHKLDENYQIVLNGKKVEITIKD